MFVEILPVLNEEDKVLQAQVRHSSGERHEIRVDGNTVGFVIEPSAVPLLQSVFRLLHHFYNLTPVMQQQYLLADEALIQLGREAARKNVPVE